MIGLFGDGSVGNPSVPVQIGTGSVGHHTDGQDAAWQTLVLMLGLGLILGSAVVLYVVVQRTRALARRRARLAMALHGMESGAAGPASDRSAEEDRQPQRQASAEPPAAPGPEPPPREPEHREPGHPEAEDSEAEAHEAEDPEPQDHEAEDRDPEPAGPEDPEPQHPEPPHPTTTAPTTPDANPRRRRRPRVTA